MTKKCFLCAGNQQDYKMSKVNANTDKIAPICDTCMFLRLDFCNDCGFINFSEDLRHSIDGKSLCVNCLPKGSFVCIHCDLRVLFKCSCDIYLCKFCAENHFVETYNKNLDKVKSGKWESHYFSTYPSLAHPETLKKCFAPDFRSFFLKKSLNQIQSNPRLANIFNPIERICDYYKQTIEILEKLGGNDWKIAKTYFAAGYYVKFCEHYKRLINSSQSQQNFSWLKLAPIYHHFHQEESQTFQDLIANNSTSISSKPIRKMLIAWSSYLKKNQIRKFGKFINKHQFMQPSKEKLLFFTIAGLITQNDNKVINIIDHLNFYFQETPEHFLLYSKLPDSENFAKISYEIVSRYSGYDNPLLIEAVLKYLTFKKQANPEEANLIFLKLFQETFLAESPECLNLLKNKVHDFISDRKTINHLNKLTLA